MADIDTDQDIIGGIFRLHASGDACAAAIHSAGLRAQLGEETDPARRTELIHDVARTEADLAIAQGLSRSATPYGAGIEEIYAAAKRQTEETIRRLSEPGSA